MLILGKVSFIRAITMSKLFGTINVKTSSKGVRKWRFRWWEPCAKSPKGKVRKQTPWHTDQAAVKRFQLRMNQDWKDGKLGGATKLLVIVDREVDEYNLRQISCNEFFDIYVNELRTRRRRADEPDSDIDNNPRFMTELLWLKRFFKYADCQTMSELTPAHISEFKSRRAMDRNPKGRLVANSTINRELNAILPMLRYAHQLNFIIDKVYENPGRLREATNREVIVFKSLEDIIAVFKTCEKVASDFLPLWWFYMGTGARQAEGFEYMKEQVVRHLKICNLYSNKTGAKATGHRRKIKLAADIHALILACCDDERNSSEFVFVDEKGIRWTKTKAARRIKAIRKAIQLPTEAGGYGWSEAKADMLIKCGVCRHTYGSIVSKIWGMKEASKYLGHSSFTTTEKYYVNIDLDYVKKGDEQFPYNCCDRKTHGALCGAIKLPQTVGIGIHGDTRGYEQKEAKKG